MLYCLPKSCWGSKRPNTVVVVDAPPPTTVSGVATWGRWGWGVGGCQIARSCSNDKERTAQPGSDACIIVVVTKCSWLIIPPSFANGAAAHLHINGASARYDVKECGLSTWLSLGSAEDIDSTTNRTQLPSRLLCASRTLNASSTPPAVLV